MIGLQPIKNHVIHDPAAIVEQQIILGLGHFHACNVVGGNALAEFHGIRALNFDLAHVADVEQPRPAAHGQMLLDNAAILDRHFPAGELHDSRARPTVRGVERSSFQTLRHIRPAKSRERLPLPLQGILGGFKGVVKEHTDRHGTDATRHRGNRRGALFGGFELDVAA